MRDYVSLVIGMGMFINMSQASSVPTFTAEAVHIIVGQVPEIGRVFVSEQGSRFEFKRKGQLIVQIIIPEQGVIRLLFPQDMTYIETTQLPHLRINQTPCPPPEVASCELTNKETLHGRLVDVWRIVFKVPGQESVDQELQSLQIWWDTERKLALQEQYPDGRKTTSILHGTANYQGRFVENWEIIMMNPEGKITRVLRWYDPELQTDVREEYQDGSIREFRDIRLVSSDPSWFVIPDNYRRIDPRLHDHSSMKHIYH